MAEKIYQEMTKFTLILSIYSKTVMSDISVRPSTVEVLVGEATFFNCSTSNTPAKPDDILWYHTPVHANQREDVYDEGIIRYKYKERFHIERDLSAGAFNLVVSAPVLEDAGRYECQDEKGYGQKFRAELVILATEPDCRTKTKPGGFLGENSCGLPPDEIELSCSVSYNGKVSPMMEWRKIGERNISQSRCGESMSLWMCNASMKAEIDLIGSSYICQTTRSNEKAHSCSSNIGNILYVVNANSTTKKTMNDEVTCTVDTRYPCNNYTWYDSSKSQVSSGRYLKPSNPGLYTCRALCYIRNESCKITAMNIEVIEDVTDAAARLNVILLLLLVLVLVAIAITAIGQWKRKSRKYKCCFGSEDRVPPVLIKTFTTRSYNDEQKEIYGLTVLDGELFLVINLSREVEVYELEEFNFCRQFELLNLIHPLDIVSCKENKFLYIMDLKNKGEGKVIFRVDSRGKSISRYPTEDDWGRLSIAEDSKVILTVREKNKLNEYSLDGLFIRQIELPSDASLFYPWHAIKLNDRHFVVSYGNQQCPLHRICLVNVDGKLQNWFGEEKGSTVGQLNSPVYLAADGNGRIFVADKKNRRVVGLMMNTNVEFIRNIVYESNDELLEPWRICLDNSKDRLFVAYSEAKTVSVFEVQKS